MFHCQWTHNQVFPLYRQWLSAVKQQAITLNNIGQVLWWHISSLDQNEWITIIQSPTHLIWPSQNCQHNADIFKCIFLNENIWISLKILLKFVPEVQINIIPTLVQIMDWHEPGDKPLSEPMMVSLLMHICITWPQWVKYVCHMYPFRYSTVTCKHVLPLWWRVIVCYRFKVLSAWSIKM